MDDNRLLKIDPPRFEDSPPLLLAGLALTRPAWEPLVGVGEAGTRGSGEAVGGASDPHPRPLPEGEGISGSFRPLAEGTAALPLPLGEGGGEGSSLMPTPQDTPTPPRSHPPALPWRPALLAVAALVGLSVLLLLPFYLSFTSFAGNSGVKVAPPVARRHADWRRSRAVAGEPFMSSLGGTVPATTPANRSIPSRSPARAASVACTSGGGGANVARLVVKP